MKKIIIDEVVLKSKYNYLLKRFYLAQSYFMRQDITDKEKMIYYPTYKKICEALNFILNLIGDYEKVEAQDGFKINTNHQGNKKVFVLKG